MDRSVSVAGTGILAGSGEAFVLVSTEESGVLSNSGVGTSSTLPSFCTTAAAAGKPLPPAPDCCAGEGMELWRESSGDSAVSGGVNPDWGGSSGDDAILAMVRQGTIAPWTVNIRRLTKIVSFDYLPHPDISDFLLRKPSVRLLFLPRGVRVNSLEVPFDDNFSSQPICNVDRSTL